MIAFKEPKPTMSLDGGLLMYTNFTLGANGIERYNSQKPPKGRTVEFINDNGYDSELEYAQKYFNKGDVLVVKEIYVGRGNSKVEFINYDGLRFNTVHFVDV